MTISGAYLLSICMPIHDDLALVCPSPIQLQERSGCNLRGPGQHFEFDMNPFRLCFPISATTGQSKQRSSSRCVLCYPSLPSASNQSNYRHALIIVDVYSLPSKPISATIFPLCARRLPPVPACTQQLATIN